MRTVIAIVAMIAPLQAQILRPIMTASTPSGGASPVFIGSGNSTNLACANGAVSCPVSYSPIAGHALYVGVVYQSGAVATSVTDNGAAGGSSYSASTTAASVNGGGNFLIWFCSPAAASGVTTITVNGGGEVVLVDEFSGSGCTVDKSNVTPNLTSGTTSFASSATAATTNAVDVSFGLHYDVSNGTSTMTGTNGYSCISPAKESAFVGNGFSMCYKILSATGAQTVTGTAGGSDAIFSIIAVFH